MCYFKNTLFEKVSKQERGVGVTRPEVVIDVRESCPITLRRLDLGRCATAEVGF